MKKFIVFIVILILIIGGWYVLSRPKMPLGGNTADNTPVPVNTVNYSCNAGKTILAEFYNGTTTPSQVPNQPPVSTGTVHVVLSDGRTMTLTQTVSADGTRYANSDESFVFWGKGNGALVLENNQQKSYIGCIKVADAPKGSDLPQIYTSATDGFSIRLPNSYTVNETYAYQLNPTKKIDGVKFTIPKAMADNTNLSKDSYISVERIASKTCSASEFLDGTHTALSMTDNGVTYSVASSSGAGAGNRYDETVYSISGSSPCIATRYYIHYGVIQNYPIGTVKEFDESALVKQFNTIRETLVLN